jgi:hypothetical protein
MLRFTATTANVSGAPDSIRIDLFRWSTDAERDKLMAAWELKPGAAGATGRGGGRGGRGAAAPVAAPGEPAPDGAPAGVAAASADGGGRAGRGRGAARSGASAAPLTPEAGLAVALKEAATIGYLWSSEAAGYALRYAGKVAWPDGSERIILITDRRLGEVNGLWKLASQTAPASFDFSVIELRLNAKGTGEGKLSLDEKVAPDAATGVVALMNYDASPVVFTGLKQTAPALKSNPAHTNPTQPNTIKPNTIKQ